jgi:hypothetical protein
MGPTHLHLVIDHKTPNSNLMRSICWEHIWFIIRDPVRHHQVRFLRVVVLETFLQTEFRNKNSGFYCLKKKVGFYWFGVSVAHVGMHCRTHYWD